MFKRGGAEESLAFNAVILAADSNCGREGRKEPMLSWLVKKTRDPSLRKKKPNPDKNWEAIQLPDSGTGASREAWG